MQSSFEFRIIRYEPDARRGERVNIGLLVYTDGEVQVRLLKNMSKALALSPQVRFHVSLQAELTAMFNSAAAAGAFAQMQGIEPFSLSQTGQFFCSRPELEDQIDAAMKRLVTPARRPSLIEGTTRLHTEIKRQFKAEGVLAVDPSEIKNHKVVAGFEFPGDNELAADFAFKNGNWHLTQVLDYRTTSAASAMRKIKEVSLKAIALDQAKKEPDRLLGDSTGVKTSAIVWVPEELADAVAAQIEILGDYAKLYRFENHREQIQYWDMMNRLTKQYAEH